MTKFNGLLSKIELFEKLSIHGNRSDFLSSLAQESTAVDPQDLGTSINNVRSVIQNWIANNAERQADIAGGQIKGLPPKLRNAYQVVRTANNFDIDSLPGLYQALLNLSTVFNLGEMGGDAKNAWLHNVFPVLGTAMDKVKKQLDFLKSWANKNPTATEIPSILPAQTQQAHFVQPTAPTGDKPKSMSGDAKALAGLLGNKISKLPSSKNREYDLKNINENVKSLQRYFRALQSKNDMPSYLARMEIVKALQNAYSGLDYNDLDVVSALNSGQGVPETPDSKI